MLKTRVITALALLVVFLAALFWLPQRAWAVFVGMLVVLAAWEWGKLIKLSQVACGLYVFVVASVCALLFGFAQGDTRGAPMLPERSGLQSAVYLGASLFWMVVVPLSLWRSWLPRAHWLAALIGVLVLVP